MSICDTFVCGWWSFGKKRYDSNLNFIKYIQSVESCKAIKFSNGVYELMNYDFKNSPSHNDLMRLIDNSADNFSLEFISHKWYGDYPDNEDKSFFKFLESNVSFDDLAYVFVDFLSVESRDVGLFLENIVDCLNKCEIVIFYENLQDYSSSAFCLLEIISYTITQVSLGYKEDFSKFLHNYRLEDGIERLKYNFILFESRLLGIKRALRLMGVGNFNFDENGLIIKRSMASLEDLSEEGIPYIKEEVIERAQLMDLLNDKFTESRLTFRDTDKKIIIDSYQKVVEEICLIRSHVLMFKEVFTSSYDVMREKSALDDELIQCKSKLDAMIESELFVLNLMSSACQLIVLKMN